MYLKKWTQYSLPLLFLLLVSLSACTFQMEVVTPEPSGNEDLQSSHQPFDPNVIPTAYIPATATAENSVSEAGAPIQVQSMEGSNPTLSLDILQNSIYRSPEWGEFQLSNGIYYRTPPEPLGLPEAYTTRLWGPVLYGDINVDGIEDAVVFLLTQNGGTGKFVEMAAVLNQNGSAYNASTISLGDRVGVEADSTKVENGTIVLNMRVHGPTEPMASASQAEIWEFRLENGQLVPISSSASVPEVAILPTPTQAPSWNLYTNPKYGYSVAYPVIYNVMTVSDEYVEIGDKIVIMVSNVDPTSPRGDGPVIESITDIQLSAYPAKLLTGYIGSVGGHIPQQYKTYVFKRNDYFLVITLYALGLHVTEGDVSQIAQLIPEDVAWFDNMIPSVQFP